MTTSGLQAGRVHTSCLQHPSRDAPPRNDVKTIRAASWKHAGLGSGQRHVFLLHGSRPAVKMEDGGSSSSSWRARPHRNGWFLLDGIYLEMDESSHFSRDCNHPWMTSKTVVTSGVPLFEQPLFESQMRCRPVPPFPSSWRQISIASIGASTSVGIRGKAFGTVGF